MIPPTEVTQLTNPLCCEGQAAPGQIRGKGGHVLILNGALGTRCAQCVAVQGADAMCSLFCMSVTLREKF